MPNTPYGFLYHGVYGGPKGPQNPVKTYLAKLKGRVCRVCITIRVKNPNIIVYRVTIQIIRVLGVQ